MTAFLIKSTVCMAILLAFYYIFLQREKMHTFNRFYLIGAIIASLILPLISIPIYIQVIQPALQQPDIILENPIVNITNVKPVLVSASPVNYQPYILISIYVLITLLLFVRFIKTIGHFYNQKKHSKTVQYEGATLVLLDVCPMPHTFLSNIYFSKTAYENNTIEPELLTHELTHAQQKHTLDILFIEVLKIIFWFNPILYLYKKAIKLNHEFLADKKVIETHANTLCYQNLLLEKAIVGTTFSIASNLNFLITKKRFIMMTKTTSQVKRIMLKLAISPLFACLVYTISTKTIAQVKSSTKPSGKTEKEPAPQTKTFTNVENAMAYLQEEEVTKTAPGADTLTGDARRDEYFKGVQIVIDDKQKGITINKPYEKLTNEQKRYYLNRVPEKKTGKGVNEKDFEFYLTHKDALFYINDSKVTREEVLKHNIKDFASSGYKFSFDTGTDGKKLEKYQMFLYTRDHFNKYIADIDKHYPEKIYKISILDKAVETGIITPSKNKDGKSDRERNMEKLQNELDAPTYPNTEEMQKSSREISISYPGGMDEFYRYFYSNLKVPANETRKDLSIFLAINTDGSVSDIMMSEEKNETVKKEITRVLLNSPKWIPAQNNGKPVKVSTVIKVNF